MSWYYADWSWVHSLVMTAAVVITVGVVVCVVVNLMRSTVSDRHDDALVTNGFVQPSPAKMEGRHAGYVRNGRWAA